MKMRHLIGSIIRKFHVPKDEFGFNKRIERANAAENRWDVMYGHIK